MAIHEASRFKLGKLLVRYLRMPLVTRRLSKRDGKLLTETIGAKIAGWSLKHLSYICQTDTINLPYSELMV